MICISRKAAPLLLMFMALLLVSGGGFVESVDARSKFGGKMFRPIPKKAPVQKSAPIAQTKSGGLGRGLAGGLVGGALAGMLFGSLFGAGGQGVGLLPILILGGVGYLLFRKFTKARHPGYSQAGSGSFQGPGGVFDQASNGSGFTDIPPADEGPEAGVDTGLEAIRQNDPGFDSAYFMEVASDVFFQVQAGWMRRDLDSYKHLLGKQLAAEYAEHFAEMRKNGVINKLESIAIRGVDIYGAGSTATEDFITVAFVASLLDYTVDESSGELVEGSMSRPVKFSEHWTWARPRGTEDWKLEGIKVIE